MTTKKNIVGLIFTVLFAGQIFGQNVGISESTFTPNDNSILELKSTLRGFLPPRLTSAERDILTGKIGAVEEGLEIYNKTRKCKEFWTGTDWTSATPAGTIRTFGGNTLPNGWLWCDGSEVSRTTYSDLWTTIGVNWGQGNNTSTMNLPDLRGQFLRGVDNMDNTVGTGGGTANIDPNVAGRTAKYAGGNTLSNVGSYQEDELINHQHNLQLGCSGSSNLANAGNAGLFGFMYANDGTTTATGGLETRSKNAYVNYIIKYYKSQIQLNSN